MKRPLTAFRFSDTRKQLDTDQNSENHVRNYFGSPKVYKYSKRSFRYELLESKKPGEVRYIEHFVVRDLNQGEMLCTRSLLSKNIALDGSDLPNIPAGIEPSKFAIIAKSSKVEVYELMKQNIVFIPEPLKSYLLENLVKVQDHDVIRDPEIENELRKWDETKEEIYLDQMFRNKRVKLDMMYKRY